MTNGNFAWEGAYPTNLSWHAELSRFPVFDLLKNAAKDYPDRSAIRFNDRSFTFSEWK